MIIKSTIKKNAGDVVTDGGIIDDKGILHFVPFMIMEVVSRDDYINEVRAKKAYIGIIFSDDNFYRISID